MYMYTNQHIFLTKYRITAHIGIEARAICKVPTRVMVMELLPVLANALLVVLQTELLDPRCNSLPQGLPNDLVLHLVVRSMQQDAKVFVMVIRAFYIGGKNRRCD